ncbi:MAG: CHAT domain-containing protein [Paludibacteraceae bacterium]|nr:CHAT domain-containing protein [Paludibacteraceae bacterium]
MKKLSLLLFALALGTLMFAQTSRCDTLMSQALSLSDKYQFSEAIERLAAASDCFSSQGKGSGEAMCMAELAGIYGLQNRLDSAVILFDKAVSIAFDNRDTTCVLDILRRKRRFFSNRNNYREVMRINNQIDSIRESSPDTSAVLLNIYQDARNALASEKDLEQTEYYLLRFKNLMDQYSKDFPAGRIQYYNLMRDLRRNQGRYAEAIGYAKEYLAFRRQSPEFSAISLGMQHLTLADLYSRVADTANTLLYADSVAACIYKFRNPIVSSNLGMANAFALQRIGHYDDAMGLLSWADSTISANQSSEDLEYLLTVRQGKSILSFAEKRYDDCVNYFDDYIDLSLSFNGEYSDAYSGDLFRFSKALARVGDNKRASEYAIRSSQIKRSVIFSTLRNASSSDYTKYWGEASKELFNVSSVCSLTGESSGSLSRAAYDALLFSRSLLLETSRSTDRVVTFSGNAEAHSLYSDVKDMKSRLVVLQCANDSNLTAIGSLKDSIASMERRLMSLIPSYCSYADFLGLTYDDIRKSMPRRSVLVEFFDYFTAYDSLRHYVAFVIDLKHNAPLFINLFTEDQFDTLLDGQRISSIYSAENNLAVRRLVWDKISSYVPKGYSVYYVPSGKLHQVSLESFKDDKGRILSDRNDFVRLTSARELLRFDSRMALPSSSLLYGGLTYDSTIFDNNYEYLPETEAEVRAIAPLLGNGVTILTGSEGTPASLSAISCKATDLIHIATHGYYFTPEEAQDVDLVKGYKDAMLLSGLIMSGLNISANEISRLDLSRTSLVVLSACQSGVGYPSPEGLYGLLRAFKLSGVQTLVMTLWSIDDNVTKQFMTSFYERLAATGWDKRRAFNEARRSLIRKYPDSPNLWACFVMID